MDPDLSAVQSFLEEAELDGYLFDTDGDNADQYYLSGFTASAGVIALYVAKNGNVELLTSSLEYGRARSESRADGVARTADYDYQQLAEEYGRRRARHRVIAAFLEDNDLASVAVSDRFPVDTADGLRGLKFRVTAPDNRPITDARAVKTEEEISQIRETQAANESAMAVAQELLATANVVDDAVVHDGERLTSERLKREIEVELLDYECALDETIVAGGPDSAEPHNRGSGPLPANEPIIIDIFPRHKETRYHGDMTRTFVVGEPSERVKELYETTHAAFEAALSTIRAGVTGEAVDDAVCDVFEAAEFPTLRSDPATETGFIHSTGHGVGLEIHENPSLAQGADEKLEAGQVVTIEPGLYDPQVGGTRIEDLVVVTESGYDNLTDYEMTFQV